MMYEDGGKATEQNNGSFDSHTSFDANNQNDIIYRFILP